MKNLQFAAMMFLVLLGIISCGGGSSQSNEHINVNGAIEKGPFIVGSTVTINILTEEGENTSSTIVTNTIDDLGRFRFSIDGKKLLQTTSTGYYRNEITGELSTDVLTLRSMYETSTEPEQYAYVNLLTHLTSNRVLQLIRTSNTSYEEAIQQAELEFLSTFERVLAGPQNSDFSSLSIYESLGSSGSAYLLAASSIIYQYAIDRSSENATNAHVELVLLINEIEEDFGSDGIIDDERKIELLRNTHFSINPQRVLDNLQSWIGSSSVYGVPDINEYLDSDLDGIVNFEDLDDDNDGVDDLDDPFPFTPNSPPVISGSPSAEVLAHGSYTYTPNVINIENEPLTYSVSNLPAWANFDEQSGEIYGIPRNEDVGLYDNITISVSDGLATDVSISFSITVVRNSWTKLPDMPIGRSSSGAAYSSNYFYVTGGYYSGTLNSLEVYDIEKGIWITKTPMDAGRHHHNAHAINNQIYVVGGVGEIDGNSSGEIASVEEYDITSNSWINKRALPEGRAYYSSCVYDEKIYVFGGTIEDEDLQTYHATHDDKVYVYDPAFDTWSAKAPMLQANSSMFCGVIENEIYVIGGEFNEYGYDIYSPGTDTWRKGGDLMQGASRGFAGAVIENAIYIVGEKVEMIRPLENISEIREALPSEVSQYWSGYTSMGGRLYMFGGSSEYHSFFSYMPN